MTWQLTKFLNFVKFYHKILHFKKHHTSFQPFHFHPDIYFHSFYITVCRHHAKLKWQITGGGERWSWLRSIFAVSYISKSQDYCKKYKHVVVGLHKIISFFYKKNYKHMWLLITKRGKERFFLLNIYLICG